MSIGLAALPVAFAMLIARHVKREGRAREATFGQVVFIFDEDGVQCGNESIAAPPEPWSCYAGFHIGHLVIVLPKKRSQIYVSVPTETLSSAELVEVSALLSAHLPELGLKDLRNRGWITI
jgi:hypothetical protein